MPRRTGISRRRRTGSVTEPSYDSPSPATEPSYDSPSPATEPSYDYSPDPQAPERMEESRERMEDFEERAQERIQTRYHQRAQQRQKQLEQQRQKQQEQQQQLRRRRRQDAGRFEAEQRMAGQRRSELRSALEQQATLFDILGLAQQERRRTLG